MMLASVHCTHSVDRYVSIVVLCYSGVQCVVSWNVMCVCVWWYREDRTRPDRTKTSVKFYLNLIKKNTYTCSNTQTHTHTRAFTYSLVLSVRMCAFIFFSYVHSHSYHHHHHHSHWAPSLSQYMSHVLLCAHITSHNTQYCAPL